MSGGSFNYLCFKTSGDLFQALGDLERMAEELEDLGPHARDAASRTRRLLALSGEIDAEILVLAEVWRFVEWWRSCDIGRDDVLVAIGKFNEQQKETHG